MTKKKAQTRKATLTDVLRAIEALREEVAKMKSQGYGYTIVQCPHQEPPKLPTYPYPGPNVTGQPWYYNSP